MTTATKTSTKKTTTRKRLTNIDKLTEFLNCLDMHARIDRVDFELYSAGAACSSMKVWIKRGRKRTGAPYFEFSVTRSKENVLVVNTRSLDIHGVAVSESTVHDLIYALSTCRDTKPLTLKPEEWRMYWRKPEDYKNNPYRIDVYDHCGH